MAEPYRTVLAQMAERLELPEAAAVTIAVKHFFNGAALYANDHICLVHNPSGLALKMRPEERGRLITSGEGALFRVFPKGPVKREYVALSESLIGDQNRLLELIEGSIGYLLDWPDGPGDSERAEKSSGVNDGPQRFCTGN